MVFESYFPTLVCGRCGEFIELKFRCPAIEFCGISTGNNELMVDGLLAKVGIGIVPLIRSSSIATGVPVTDPVALGVVE